jgi:hypothetical protein
MAKIVTILYTTLDVVDSFNSGHYAQWIPDGSVHLTIKTNRGTPVDSRHPIWAIIERDIESWCAMDGYPSGQIIFTPHGSIGSPKHPLERKQYQLGNVIYDVHFRI